MKKILYTVAMIAAATTSFAQCTDDFKAWDTWRIVGEIEGVWDNGYHDAKLDRDYDRMLELEAYMVALHNEICHRGEIDDSGIPYNTFGKPRKTSSELIRFYKRESRRNK